MNLSEFENLVESTTQDFCRDTFARNRESIRIKKEATAVKNLSKIFDATLRISNEKGFSAMSMRDLSQKSGLSMGALYAYFSGKEDLLEMLQRHGRTIAGRILESRIGAAEGPWNKLRVGIQTHLYLSECMQSWFYFSFMETRHLSGAEKEKAIGSELYTDNMFREIIELGQRGGIFEERDPIMTASAIKALLQDWYLKRGKHTKRNVTVEIYARFVLDFVRAFVMKDAAEVP